MHDHAPVFAAFDFSLENAEKIAGMTISLIMKGLGFLLVGLSLGIVYFGGLWFTLRRLHAWRKPYLWLAMSWFGRLAILLGGGAWLLNQTVASPLMVILLVSFENDNSASCSSSTNLESLYIGGKSTNRPLTIEASMVLLRV